MRLVDGLGEAPRVGEVGVRRLPPQEVGVRGIGEAARDAGAEIRTGAPVREILVDSGRASGVALEDGEEIRSTAVLSNADPKTTLLGLVGPGQLPERFTAALRAYRSSAANSE